MQKAIRWDANRPQGKRKFTKREMHELSYGAIMYMVARMELVETRAQRGTGEEREAARVAREQSELALAELISQVPANPSLSTCEGLDLIEIIKDEIAAIRKAQDAEKRRKLKADDPLAVAMRERSSDLSQFALVMMQRTRQERPMRLPRRFS